MKEWVRAADADDDKYKRKNIKERQDRGFMIKEGVVLVFLGISTWTDLRKRQVSLIITGLFAAAGLGWMLYRS